MSLRFVTRYIQLCSVLLLFFAGGILLIALENDASGPVSFARNYLPGDLFRVRLEAVSHPEEGSWKRAVGRSDLVFRNGRGKQIDGRVLLYFSPETRVRTGDLCLLSASMQAIRNRHNPGEFDAEFYWRSKGITRVGFVSTDELRILGNHISVFDRFLEHIRTYFRRVLDHFLPDDENQMAHALLLGDRDLLERETTEAFSRAGIMHLLAVSGLHVGIFFAMIIYLAGFFRNRVRRRQAIVAAILLIWLYAFLTGLSPSVFRAVLMFSIIGLAEVLRRGQDSVNTLFAAAFVILLFDPLALFDIGFQLSFMAMLSIYLFNRHVTEFFRPRSRIIRFFWDGTAVGLSAQVLTFPLSLYYFHQFPNYFWLANLVVILLGGVVLGSGLLLVLFSKVPLLNKLLAFIFWLGLWLVLQTGYRVSDFPFSAAKGFIPSVTVVFLLVGFVLLWRIGLLNRYRRLRFVFPAMLVLLFVFVHLQRAARLSASNLVVYNSNFTCFSIKLNGRVFFFYEGAEKQRERAAYLARSFSAVYPAKASFYALQADKDLRLRWQGSILAVRRSGNGEVELHLPGEDLRIDAAAKRVVYHARGDSAAVASFAERAFVRSLRPG